jgi:hypothetical protein
MSKTAKGEVEAIKSLVEDYIRGDKTVDEIRDHIRSDAALAPSLDNCLGCNSLPQELLESIGLNPFEAEVSFSKKLTISREGLARNLRMARERILSPKALCEWATDWFTWQIAERPDDHVVLELAGELMLGEEQIESILFSSEHYDLFQWHIENTPPKMGDNVALGLVVAEHLEDLAAQLRQRITEEISQEALRDYLARLFRENRQSFPTFEDDFCDAVEQLRHKPLAYEAIDSFLRCVGRTADPLACADSISSE